MNGRRLSRLPGNVRFREQEYDFGCGELRTRFELHAEEVTATVEVLSFCSRSLPLVAAQEVHVCSDHACDLVGYPMLCAPLGVWPARLGDHKRSAELFEAGYADFIDDPYRETNEFSNTRFPEKPRVGPLFGNIGGFLTSLIYGLASIELGPGQPETWLQEGPITMPDGWRAIEIERVWVRGRPMRLSARHGSERSQLIPEG